MSEASITLISKAGPHAGAHAAHDGVLQPGWHLSAAALTLLTAQTRTLPLEKLLEELCQLLNATEDMHLIRVNFGLPTYDPQIMSHVYFWTPENGGKTSTRSHEVYTSGQYQNSPLPSLYQNGVGARVCFAAGETCAFGIEPELLAIGATDYLILPMAFHDGIGGHIGWTSNRPGGWTDHQINILHGISNLLALRADGYAHAYSLRNITRTYLGQRPSQQVLSGAVRQGVDHEITAAIWYCDLRGYTNFSDHHTPRETWEMLDQYFKCMVPAITHWGGDVIKFIGDAVLAIFEIDRVSKAETVHFAALKAAQDARQRLEAVNKARHAAGQTMIEAGIALHHGTLHLGNIGAEDRLDFTVIGSAVNEVTRIESLCRPLKRAFLASKTFQERCELAASHLSSIGTHELKGVGEPREIFTDINWQLQMQMGLDNTHDQKEDATQSAQSPHHTAC